MDRLEPILRRTTVYRIVELWDRAHGPAEGKDRALLLELAGLGAEGRGVSSASSRLGVSRTTLHRSLEALRLAGWSSAEARDKVIKTLGEGRLEVGESSPGRERPG